MTSRRQTYIILLTTDQRFSWQPLLVFGGIIAVVVLRLGSLSIYKHAQPVQQEPSQSSILLDDYFQAHTSRELRAKIITYTVHKDDSIERLAKKFNISIDTIKWANRLPSDALIPGQTLTILPVTGVAHNVVKGDTIQSLAARYHADAQQIADYPFNRFANSGSFALQEGETIIIPYGRP